MKLIHRRLSYIFRGTRLYIRIFCNNSDIAFSTGLSIDKSKFDGSRCLSGSTHGRSLIPWHVINSRLSALEQKINNAFYEYELADKSPVLSDIRDSVMGVKSPVSDFRNVYLEYLSEGERKRFWAPNTVKSARQIGRLFLKFAPKVSLESLDAELLASFVEWQKFNKLSDKDSSGVQPGFSNAVIRKNCRVLKWFLKWAADKGYINSEVFKNFPPSVKAISKPVLFLTWEELMLMTEHDFLSGSDLDRARDFFCFCCFTSLRFSDALALKKSSVKKNSFEVVSKKTSSRITIDLNDYSRAIISKYRNSEGEYLLPRFTVHRLNTLLKRIGKELKIDSPVTISQYYGNRRVEKTFPKYELLSSHFGRRTFITNALALGISPHIVMKWTGHTEYASMRPYIDVADKVRSSSMSVFDSALRRDRKR